MQANSYTEDTGFTMKSFSSLLIGFKASVSLSYDISTGVTNALVHGTESNEELGWLEEDCKRRFSVDVFKYLPGLLCFVN
jgi:hypothetical protein